MRKHKILKEYFEMEDYYAFWGWILPKDTTGLNIETDRLVNSKGQIGSGNLYIPNISDKRNNNKNFTHSDLMNSVVPGLNKNGYMGYKKAFVSGMFRFKIEQGRLDIQYFISKNYKINIKDLYNGVKAIDNICNKSILLQKENILREIFGDLFEYRQFTKIQLRIERESSIKDDYIDIYVSANTPEDLIENLKERLSKEFIQEETNMDLKYAIGLLSNISKNKNHIHNILNESTDPLISLDEVMNIAISLFESDEGGDGIPTAKSVESTETNKENNEVEPQEEDSQQYNDIEERIKTEIDNEENETKKQILVNLLDMIPVLKKFNKQSYKQILNVIYKFYTKGDDEQKLNDSEKNILSDICLDLFNTIIKNKDLVSIINTESKIMINSGFDPTLNEEYLTEARKKKTQKKKTKDSGMTAKLEVLLRLGLVPKELFTRAKRALNAKKETGSIPMYRNLLFDILTEIVHYIEKDPTLYNRMRINIMKEVKKSYPTKQTVMDAFENGRKCKEEGTEMPSDYNSDYILKSAWNRGFNDKSAPVVKSTISEQDKEKNEDNVSSLEHCNDVYCKYTRPCKCQCEGCIGAKSQDNK